MSHADDKTFAELSKWLKANKLECHTKLKGGSFILVKRRPRKSRLTGEPR